MEETLSRVFENMIDRVSGPMNLRLLLQPLMASIFAITSGLNDARAHRPPYFWGLFVYPSARHEMIRDGWKSVGKVFAVAFLLDVVYQLTVQRWVYPLEALLTAAILAIIPYTLLRGVVNRLDRRIEG